MIFPGVSIKFKLYNMKKRTKNHETIIEQKLKPTIKEMKTIKNELRMIKSQKDFKSDHKNLPIMYTCGSNVTSPSNPSTMLHDGSNFPKVRLP